jgi:hypothetical protein
MAFSWAAANYPAHKTELAVGAAAAYAAAVAAPSFWSELSTDATRSEKGVTAPAIARSPLWTHGQPDHLLSLWQEMKAELLAAKQDWQDWTIWYDDRLDGRVRDETRELAYVRIEEALWDQGPAVVNAEIERRIVMSSYEGRLRGRATDLEPQLAYEGIEEAISGQGQTTENARAFSDQDGLYPAVTK